MYDIPLLIHLKKTPRFDFILKQLVGPEWFLTAVAFEMLRMFLCVFKIH